MTLTAARRHTIVPVSRPSVVIMAGGTAEEKTPKPLTDIGGRPVVWHSMKHFAHYGMNDFVVSLGYQGEQIKRCMFDYCSGGAPGSDEAWSVDLLSTGIETLTGGRLRQIREHVSLGAFVLTNGVAVTDLDLDDLLAFHRAHHRLATAVAVRPEARFGKLELSGDQVVEFMEKPDFEQGWISASMFVLEPGVFDYIGFDDIDWQDSLEGLAADGELLAYRHASFWQGVETLRDRQLLEQLWQGGNAPWKLWD